MTAVRDRASPELSDPVALGALPSPAATSGDARPRIDQIREATVREIAPQRPRFSPGTTRY